MKGDSVASVIATVSLQICTVTPNLEWTIRDEDRLVSFEALLQSLSAIEGSNGDVNGMVGKTLPVTRGSYHE